ncbi:MAG TPA: trypsin-like peptidase domain-containing protein [Saprospiraceae bacterium]|nr:trypsin-like peptidase domain-containing protein [Saprospiraceae bacterium]
MVKRYVLIFSISLLGTFSGLWIYYNCFDTVEKVFLEQESRVVQAAEKRFLLSDQLAATFASSAPTDFIYAANKSREAVVSVKSLKEMNGSNYKNTYSSSSGSGVLISPDGYIVTNHHVINDANSIEVMLNNNKIYKARLIGNDPSTDLAVIKIDTDHLPFLYFGNSDSLAIGEWVLAVGNPFRLQSTVTAGIVSAKARNINILEDFGIESFIQTDAAVNPGNSGGALVNTQGQLVGIIAAIMTYSGKYEGFSFAIPSNLTRKVITDIIEYGSVQRGWMGVSITNVKNDDALKLGLKDVNGVMIERVNKGGAADDAGLKSGDIIVYLNEFPVRGTPEFMEHLGRYRPGDQIKVTYQRKNKEFQVNVILRNQKNTFDLIAVRKDKVLQDMGLEVRDLDSEEKVKFGFGIYVVSIDRNSLIGDTNMEPGYIIQKCNGKVLEDANSLVEYLNSNKGLIELEGFYDSFPGEYTYTFNF